MIVSKLIKILKSFLSQNIKIIYHQPATNTRFFFHLIHSSVLLVMKNVRNKLWIVQVAYISQHQQKLLMLNADFVNLNEKR